MTPVDRLIAIEEIRALKATYWISVDTRDWETLKELFTPDMTFDYPEYRGRKVPVDEHFNYVRDNWSVGVSVHHGSEPLIKIINETNATGIWPFQDRLFFSQDKPGPHGLTYYEGDGFYRETYRKVDGKWKIAAQAQTRLRVVTSSAGSPDNTEIFKDQSR
jgi:hypothetical protein